MTDGDAASQVRDVRVVDSLDERGPRRKAFFSPAEANQIPRQRFFEFIQEAGFQMAEAHPIDNALQRFEDSDSHSEACCNA